MSALISPRDIFIYDAEYSEKTRKTVIFLPFTNLSEEEIIDDIKHELKKYFTTPCEYFLIFKHSQTQLDETTQKAIFEDFDPKFIELNKIEIIDFDVDGSFSNTPKWLTTSRLESYLALGLQKIFTERGGLVSSHANHHFVFPSGKHSSKFIRVGNILTNGNEINFIGLSILKGLSNRPTIIYTDTSSINSIVYAGIGLINKFSNEKYFPIIQSFGSYDNLEKHRILKDSYILISASTSGGIVKRILESKVSNVKTSQISILYYLENIGAEYVDLAICNLTKSTINESGVKPFEQYPQNTNCNFCNKGSYPVSVTGDNFLLEPPKINKVGIVATDIPNKFSDLMENFISTTTGAINYIKCNKGSGDNKYELFIDFETIVENINQENTLDEFRKKLNFILETKIPATTSHILYLEDEGSEAFAKHVSKALAKNCKTEPKCITVKELRTENPDNIKLILVVASCLVRGNDILMLSRELRDYTSKSGLIYLVGINRFRDSKKESFIKSNLTYGKYGINTYPYFAIESLYNTTKKELNPWLNELNLLESKTSFDTFLTSKIKLRINEISNNDGLVDNLFLTNPITQNQIELKHNFAFLKFDNYVNSISQADVYFIVSSIFNKLRTNKEERTLRQSTFEKNLVDPQNFDRFNDPILHCCILRAALPEELNYTFCSETSGEMLSFCLKVLNNINNGNNIEGDSICELLLALCTKRLRLKASDFGIFKEKLNQKVFSLTAGQDELFMELVDSLNHLK